MAFELQVEIPRCIPKRALIRIPEGTPGVAKISKAIQVEIPQRIPCGAS